jgi:phosphatidylinositol dimannoside acyltransferase
VRPDPGEDGNAGAPSGRVPHPPPLLRLGLQGATAAVRGLGGARYTLADGLGLAAVALLRRRVRAAAANHRRLAPEIDAREARRRARASFRGFARTGVDFLWANGMDEAEVLRVSEVRGGREECDLATAAGHGGILCLTHFGNWDMAANIAHAIGLRLTTVMAETGPRGITDLVIWARQRNHLEVFEAAEAARGLVRALRCNRFVALLCDLPGGGPTVDVDYCGGRVAFSTVPAWLARRTGAPLLPTACWREGDRYVIQAFSLIQARREDDEGELMQGVATTIEPVVRRHPDQWYPFRAMGPEPATAVD